MKLSPSVFVVIYVLSVTGANAQIIDATTIINNQIDRNAYDTLTQPSTLAPPKINGSGGKLALSLDQGGLYSGFLINPPTLTKSVLFYQTFAEKNSFLGMGVTDTYTAQLGLDLKTRWGTDFQPFVSYAYGSRDLVGINTYRSSGVGGAFAVSQKIYPPYAITRGQSGAVANLGDPNPGAPSKELFDADGNSQGNFKKDIYPNCDWFAGLTAGLTAPDVAMEKAGAWTHTHQDMWTLSPSVTYDLYLRPTITTDDDFQPTSGDWTSSLIPNSVSFNSTYSYMAGSSNDGTSSSGGLLSIQARNMWAIPVGVSSLPINSKGEPTDLVPHSDGTIQIIQIDTLLHDTNQEPATPPASPIPYQNWAKFGLSVGYVTADWNLKVEYDYEAFNALYDSQTVNLSLSVAF